MSNDPAVQRAREPVMSLAEWADLPEDEPGEIVDGRLVEDEVPSFVHELVVAWLVSVLNAWGWSRGAFVAGSGVKLGVSAATGRMADVIVYFAGDRLPPRRGLVRVPPDIAIEIVSPTPRDARCDRIDKLDEYAAFGVRWYWIVDPGVHTVEVFELNADGRYVHRLGAADGVIEEVPGCPGLRLDLDGLWARVDELPPDEA
jgi:Uma2 family endonuclease